MVPFKGVVVFLCYFLSPDNCSGDHKHDSDGGCVDVGGKNDISDTNGFKVTRRATLDRFAGSMWRSRSRASTVSQNTRSVSLLSNF